MAISTIVKTKRDGTLAIKDGASSPDTFTIAYEAGDLSITIPGPATNAYLDRGVLGATPSVRYGDEQPITGSFTAYLRDLSDGAYVTLAGILSQSGSAASWESTLGANAEVFAVQLVYTIEGTDHGDSADHTITLNHCVLNGSISEGDPSTISINFTSYDSLPTLT